MHSSVEVLDLYNLNVHRRRVGLIGYSDYQALQQIESTEETEQGYLRTLIKLNNGSTNDLLQSLVGKTTIHSFVERIPSMNDIFITKVKSDNNE